MRDRVQMHTGIFQYNNRQITFHFWTNSGTPDTIIFLGTAQVGKIPKWVAESAPDGVVVVDGLPHWKAHPSAHDLKQFTIDYTFTAFQAILKKFKIPSAHVIASSQAVPGVIWITNRVLNQVRNIGLITPLGFTAAIFGDSLKDRIKKLKRRAFFSSLQFSHSVLHDPRNFYISLILLRALLLESEWGASDRKYAAGLSSDLLEDTRIIADKLWSKGNSFTIFLGEKDKIFPPHEVLASLKKAKLQHIDTVTLPNLSHSSLALRGNREALAKIVNLVKEQRKYQ